MDDIYKFQSVTSFVFFISKHIYTDGKVSLDQF